jgi:hypothetical protein
MFAYAPPGITSVAEEDKIKDTEESVDNLMAKLRGL